MVKYYSINGKLTPKEEAALSVEDIAILRGYGMFDYFLVQNRQPLFIEDHFDRLWRNAEYMMLEVPMSRDELTNAVHEVIEANGMDMASIRIVLTGGVSDGGFRIPGKQNLLILQHAYPTYPQSEYDNGIKLILHEYMRSMPQAKSTDYAMGVRMYPTVLSEDASGVLYHWKGVIHEMARANFYIVKEDGTIVTTEDRILHGITRKHVLELAEQNYRVEKRDIEIEEIKTAKEAFMTNTTRRLMSVVKIDDIVVGDGKPGMVANDLRDKLFAEEKKYVAGKVMV